MKKKGLLIGLLLMAVGFAAVTTTLYINGTTTINSNDSDFKVYYSDAKVNGKQNLSVVKDETHLSFTTILDTLGETYVLDYDVTNGSKNYDADLEMTCTGGNDYLTVTNEFDDETILEALKTRSGKLSLTQKKSNTGEDVTVTIECNIKANAVERNTLGSGTAASPVEPSASAFVYTDSDGDGVISEGDVYTLGTSENEKFNVISQTDTTVTLLASNVLYTDYRQTTNTRYNYNVTFSNVNGWEYTPGPKEINIQAYDGSAKTYVNEYVSYLQTETGATSISGNLITLAELKKLGCTINDDYSIASESTCKNSEHADWLVNGRDWYTRSAYSGRDNLVWSMLTSGNMTISNFNSSNCGIRPVITISKDDLNNL